MAERERVFGRSLDRNSHSSINHAMQPTNNQPSPKHPNWNVAVLAVLREHKGPITPRTLYSKVRAAAPDLVAGNPLHADDKIRQVLQRVGRLGLADHVGRGLWEAARK